MEWQDAIGEKGQIFKVNTLESQKEVLRKCGKRSRSKRDCLVGFVSMQIANLSLEEVQLLKHVYVGVASPTHCCETETPTITGYVSSSEGKIAEKIEGMVASKYLRIIYRKNWLIYGGPRWRSWLRHRQVAGSIPDGVSGFFHWHYGPGVDSASNGNEYQEYFLGGKLGRCVGLTTLPPSCADCLEIWEPQPPGTLWACPGL
jgi:hypothetical protein